MPQNSVDLRCLLFDNARQDAQGDAADWLKASMLGMGLCERWPARVDFRLMTTQSLKNSGPADDALEFMQSSQPAVWDHWAAWILLAEIQVRRGEKEEAREALAKCVELAPDKRLQILNEPAFEGLW